MKLSRIYLPVVAAVMLCAAPTIWGAETFRVGFPSLATGFVPSWVAADKRLWKKMGSTSN